jgi:hypothetical protein
MLWINLVDKTGSGLWVSVTALYFVVVAGLGASTTGLLLGIGGAFGIAGPPIAGLLADRLPLTRVLLAVQIVRAASSLLLLLAHGFWPLLPLVALGSFGERSAAVLTKLFAARVAGPCRARYQALQRTVVNLGYTVGGLAASAALAYGGTAVYRALLLGDGLSFVLVALLVARCAEPPAASRTIVARTAAGPVAPGPAGPQTARSGTAADQEPAASRVSAAADQGCEGGSSRTGGKGVTGRYGDAGARDLAGGPDFTSGRSTDNPWRDRGYLGYAAFDAAMFLHGSALTVGLPLWIVTRTTAPHGLAAAIFVVNSVIVVACQVRLSRHASGPLVAAHALRRVAVWFLLLGAAAALAVLHAPWSAALAVLGSAVALTVVEMIQSAISWELSVSLAPDHVQGAYVGVHGLAQSTARCVGPLLMTSVVITAGPAGWLALGAALAAAALLQRRLVLRRLACRGRAAGQPPLSVAAVTVGEH